MRGSPLPLQSHLPSTLPDLLSAFRDLSVRFLPDVLSFSQCLPNDSVCYYAIYHTYLIRFCQVEPVILLTVQTGYFAYCSLLFAAAWADFCALQCHQFILQTGDLCFRRFSKFMQTKTP